jgi:hypothetical protein|tara:strand:- start:2604 stop:3182 length:579 start_codon:yes stop_codon:yes gene_type:complete
MKSSPLKHIGRHPADQYTQNPGHRASDHEGGNLTFDAMGNNIVTDESQRDILAREAAELSLVNDAKIRSEEILINSNNAINAFITNANENPAETIRQVKTRAYQLNAGMKVNDSLRKEYEYNFTLLKEGLEQYQHTVDSIYDVNLPLIDIANQKAALPPESYQEHGELDTEQEEYIAMHPRDRAKHVKKNYR